MQCCCSRLLLWFRTLLLKIFYLSVFPYVSYILTDISLQHLSNFYDLAFLLYFSHSTTLFLHYQLFLYIASCTLIRKFFFIYFFNTLFIKTNSSWLISEPEIKALEIKTSMVFNLVFIVGPPPPPLPQLYKREVLLK